MKVRIIGAGFSGLAMAYALIKRGADVEVIEKSDRVGGLLTSHRMEWGLVEGAANGIRASKNVLQLSHDIGLELKKMKKSNRRRYIFRGKAKQVPLTPFELTRMSVGLFKRPRPSAFQDLRGYAEAVFGFGAANYLIEPAVFGIFADKAENLSANLIYNYFLKYRSEKSAEARGTLAPEEGMEALAIKMSQYIQDRGGKIRFNQKVDSIGHNATVLATDAHHAADLMEPKDEWVAEQLRKIKYLPLSSICLGYRENDREIAGFGCLFPSIEDFNSLGVLFNNDIFEKRGPYNTETWLLRGASYSEDELLSLVYKDRDRLVGHSRKADEVRITQWPKALPQYSIELERVLASLVLPQSVYLAGNYLGRMGLAKILDQCHETADRIIKNES